MSIQHQSSIQLKDTEQRRQFKSHSKHGSLFIKKLIEPVSQTYLNAIRPVKKPRARVPMYISLLTEGDEMLVDAEVLALITLVVCLDNLKSPSNKLTLARKVSEYVLQEINYGTLEASNPGLIKGIQSYTQSHRARRRIDDAVKGGEFGNVDLVEWSIEQKHHVGLVLLQLLVRQGLLITCKEPGSRAAKYYWSAEVEEWSAEVYERMLFLSPAYLPLTDKPLGYDQDIEHSYGSSFPPINFRLRVSRDAEEPKKNLHNGLTLEAADQLAQVPYQINSSVFKTVLELWNMGIEVGKLPAKNPTELPGLLAEGSDPEEIKKRNSIASKIHIHNAKTKGLRLYTQRQLTIISDYEDKELYFLWQADSRGRLYPLATTLLNPQGHDLSKGLLKFHNSRAKKLGTKGVVQLKRAIAEHYGIDKVSMVDREEWTNTNIDTILSVADSPVNNRELWMNADSPFQFLAACIELHDALESTGGQPEEYLSSYIKYFDGTCSAVQHWSTMLEDRDAASSVGLTTSSENDHPPDLYSHILLKTIEQYIINVDESDSAGMWWKDLTMKGLLDRKLTKPIVMTYTYGSKSSTWRDHIRQWLKSKDIELDTILRDLKVVNWFSNCIHECMKTELASLVDGMKWISTCGRLISKVSDDIEWASPTGFQVMQSYRKKKTGLVFVSSKALSIQIKLTKSMLTDQVNKTKQASALPPNFIHSMDSSHLVFTSMHMRKDDRCLSVIHDSFGCLLGDTDYLTRVVKQQFINLYSNNTLEDYKKFWENKYKIELPDVPIVGGYNVREIAQSTYAFS